MRIPLPYDGALPKATNIAEAEMLRRPVDPDGPGPAEVGTEGSEISRRPVDPDGPDDASMVIFCALYAATAPSTATMYPPCARSQRGIALARRLASESSPTPATQQK